MVQESREVELLTETTTAPPDPEAAYVAVRETGETGEQWFKLASDAEDVTEADLDFQ